MPSRARTRRTVSTWLPRPSGVAETSRITISSAPCSSYSAARSAGSPASRRPWKRMPLTTRPWLTSRQGMIRRASISEPSAERRQRQTPRASGRSADGHRRPRAPGGTGRRRPGRARAPRRSARHARRSRSGSPAPRARGSCWRSRRSPAQGSGSPARGSTRFQPNCGTRTVSGNRPTRPAIAPSPFAAWAFVAFLEQDLKTDAHRERRRGRPAPGRRSPARARPRAGPPCAAPKVPTPGSTTRSAASTIAASSASRVGGAEPREGGQDRGEIGGAGRQDHDLGPAHSTPLVLGTWSGPSIRTAWRSASAVALKAASAR